MTKPKKINVPVTAPPPVRKPTQIRSKIHKEATTYQAGVMGLLGMNSRAIANATGLTEGKIAYRLRIAGVKRMDYRNGTSETAQFMLSKARTFAQERFTEMLREKLGL